MESAVTWETSNILSESPLYIPISLNLSSNHWHSPDCNDRSDEGYSLLSNNHSVHNLFPIPEIKSLHHVLIQFYTRADYSTILLCECHSAECKITVLVFGKLSAKRDPSHPGRCSLGIFCVAPRCTECLVPRHFFEWRRQ